MREAHRCCRCGECARRVAGVAGYDTADVATTNVATADAGRAGGTTAADGDKEDESPGLDSARDPWVDCDFLCRLRDGGRVFCAESGYRAGEDDHGGESERGSGFDGYRSADDYNSGQEDRRRSHDVLR